jgi:hypothetical protein
VDGVVTEDQAVEKRQELILPPSPHTLGIDEQE